MLNRMLNLTYGLTLFLHSYVIVLTWETVTLDVKKYVKPYVKKNVKIFRFNIRFNIRNDRCLTFFE
jgi:hypothetical protein